MSRTASWPHVWGNGAIGDGWMVVGKEEAADAPPPAELGGCGGVGDEGQNPCQSQEKEQLGEREFLSSSV